MNTANISELKIETAIEETYNPSKLVPHEQVLKMIDKWLKE